MTESNDGYSYRERLSDAANGSSLVAWLVTRHRHSNEHTWRARIAIGEVRLDGEPTTAEVRLRAGQLLVWDKPPWQEPPADLSFEILFEDEDLLAVSKPSGLPTMPGAGYLAHTLLALVQRHAATARPMHRLGRGTSGLVLFAKTAAAARGVQDQWQARSVSKLYRALASGSPASDAFRCDERIGLVPDPVVGELYSATPSGRPARSNVDVIERRRGRTLVEVTIETGRPHQIRIHLAAAGHALVGDPLYGPRGVRREGSSARPGDTGYLLHAYRLALLHPRTGGRLELESPPPSELR